MGTVPIPRHERWLCRLPQHHVIFDLATALHFLGLWGGCGLKDTRSSPSRDALLAIAVVQASTDRPV